MGLIVRILGPVVVDLSTPRGSLSPKSRLVLAVLAANRGAVVSIDRLCDALWGYEQPATSVATLQSHLSRVRRLLAPEGEVVALDHGYRLELPDGAIDVDYFVRLARRASEAAEPSEAAGLYASALAWWRGPAFGDLADHEWIRAEAVRLDELRQTNIEQWMEQRLAAGGDGSLIADLEGLTRANPLRERFLRQLMVGLFRDGRRTDALRRGHEFRALLRDGMGLDPSPALLAIEGRILADDPVLAGIPEGSLASGGQPAVIDDPTRLVGRERDLAQIAHAIEKAALVTLVGPGGVGKTRLARRVAATGDGLGNGAAFVELAAVNDPASLADAVATALDVRPRQQLTIEDTLVAALVERHQLVVFDNCEHLLDSLVPFVDRVRTHCPLVHVLATSREALGLPGEVVLEVPPLAVVAPGVADPELVAEASAVELLLDRVAAAVPGFTITAANVAALGEISRRLDGLPLALELVAARFRSLAPETILQRLVVPSIVLGASMRSADPRHRTLRATIGWSFSHLSPPEQALFARLSTFAGSFDLPAVESVCGGHVVEPIDGHGEGADVVEVLAALVDKSMVQLVSRESRRYQLLETLREYGREKLGDLGSTELIDKAHLRWFTELAERASIGLAGPDEAGWSQRIEWDLDNFRVADRRAISTGDVDAALRLVSSLREFSFRHIRYELTTWAATCIAIPGAADHPKYPVVTAMVSYGHFVRGDLESSIDIGLRAVAYEAPGADSSGLAERALGNALFYLGRTDEALQWMDRMVALARRGSPARLAHALYMRSVAETSLGRPAQGAILAGQAKAAARASGSPTAQAQAAYALGLALEASNPAESLPLLRESAQLAGAAGNRWVEAFAQTEVWWLEARNGEVRPALFGSGGVIDTWHREGDWANLRLSLRRVFGLFMQIGDHYAAAVLHGALNASGATSALPFEPADAEDLDAAVDRLRTGFGAVRFETAVETGVGLSEAALVTFVQERIALQSAL